MSLTMEDKRRVIARNFFEDNRDQYEDYHEALSEFMNPENANDSFVEFGVEAYLEPEDGHRIYVLPTGHVCAVRDADGLLVPRTEISQSDGYEIEEQWASAQETFPDLDGHDLLIKMGWKEA